ncbi:MAG: exodeoxyribonuclease III [Verrucomicrobiota bacterium]
MKLLSWNVNGLRAAMNKGLPAFVAAEQADVVCLQESRCTEADVEPLAFPGYQLLLHAAEKRGYSGTAILTRRPPLRVTRGLGLPEHDREGRVLTAEFTGFHLVNVYVPNSQRELTRLAYRQQWDRDFLAYLRRLMQDKPVVCCGDLNVAHTEIDLARPKDNLRNHGFTAEERAGFSAFLEAGFIDTFRHFEKGPGHYTWWSQMNQARPRNIGWRIDYFLVSASLRDRLRSATIRPEVTGSDHCPVGLELADGGP